MTKRIIFFLVIAIGLASCAALGTKTLYSSVTKPEIQKLAFAKLDGDSIVSRIFPQTDSIFSETLIETFKIYNLNDVIPVKSEFSLDKPDTNAITLFCKENNVDGFIVSRLKFIHVTYNMYFIPIAKNWDTEIEMKLFDKKGTLVTTVLHNTRKGNSYFMPPAADKTISDGTLGATKQIAKELGLTK